MSKPQMLTTEDFIRRTSDKLETLGRRPTATRALKATIDPFWTAGLPTVIIDGEDFTRTAGYPWDPGPTGSWVPTPGQRVYVVPSNPDGWIIAGPIIETRPLMNVIKLAPYRTAAWQDYDATYREWYVSESLDSITILGGLAAPASAVNAGDVILTLPDAFCPVWATTERVRFPVNSTDTAAAVDVWGDGRITTVSSVTSFLSLSGIAFPNINSSAVYTPIAPTGSGAPAEFAGNWVQYADASFSAPGFWKDPYGWVWWKGQLTNPASIIGANTAMVTLNDASLHAVHGEIFLNVGTGGGLGIAGYCDWGTFDYISWRNGTAWTAAGSLSLGGIIAETPQASAYMYEPSAIVSGWSNYGSQYMPFGLGLRPDGIAVARGLIHGGTVPASFANVLAGAGYLRPGAVSMRPRGFNGGATTNGLLVNRPSNDARGRLDIRSDSNLYINAGSASWFSLDGVFWAPEW